MLSYKNALVELSGRAYCFWILRYGWFKKLSLARRGIDDEMLRIIAVYIDYHPCDVNLDLSQNSAITGEASHTSRSTLQKLNALNHMNSKPTTLLTAVLHTQATVFERKWCWRYFFPSSPVATLFWICLTTMTLVLRLCTTWERWCRCVFLHALDCSRRELMSGVSAKSRQWQMSMTVGLLVY
jgi:magnesium-transporting ATPase (P-type)